MRFPPAIQKLIEHFRDLPSVGPKTAEKFVFHLLGQSPERLQSFAQSLAELKEKIRTCHDCLAAAETDPCHICADPKRRPDQLCIVADTRDYLAIESSGSYQGRYFILGGVLDAVERVRPDDLNLPRLAARLDRTDVKEVIIALNPDFKGESTALYLKNLLKTRPIKITRLARGLPSGSEILYADEVTLSNAIKHRIDL